MERGHGEVSVHGPEPPWLLRRRPREVGPAARRLRSRSPRYLCWQSAEATPPAAHAQRTQTRTHTNTYAQATCTHARAPPPPHTCAKLTQYARNRIAASVLPSHAPIPGSHTLIPSSHTLIPSSHTLIPGSHTPIPSSHTLIPSSHTLIPSSHTLIPSSHTLIPSSHTPCATGLVLLPYAGSSHTVTPRSCTAVIVLAGTSFSFVSIPVHSAY